ncbi:MAG: oxidoreductase [Bacteroidetes bacterium]|nr:oxidoreductase [Bacteroidota bacterium]
MNRTIKTGIASFGMSGKVFHAPLLFNHKGFELKTIVERSKNEASALYPTVSVIRDVDALLADDEIELVIINTPDSSHYELALKAIHAGKNVIVEKPFTQTLEQANELIEAAKQKNVMLSVFQNRRWDADFLTIQKVIKSNLVGRLVEFESHFDRFRNFIQPNTWKEKAEAGTGTLYNLGSHLIDQAVVLFGMPDAVNAEIRVLRPGGEVDDCFDIRLSYNFIKVTLKASYLVREAGPKYQLHGINGSFLKWGLDPQEDALKAGGIPGSTGWGSEPEAAWGVLNSDLDGIHVKGKVETIPGNYLAFYDNIYDHLVDGKPLAVKAEQAADTIKIIRAVYMSNELNKTIRLAEM